MRNTAGTDAATLKGAGFSGIAGALLRYAQHFFLAGGILPLILVLAVVGFGAAEPRFLSGDNLFNVARQSSFLVVVSLGQMLTLLVRGVDMSVGSTEALVSVCIALVMSTLLAAHPSSAWFSIACGIGTALLVGAAVGAANGIGIAIFNVNPFIMTVGMLSVLSGIALTLSGGMPVYGLPPQFADIFAYASPLGVPAPVWFAGGLYLLMFYLLYWTPLGPRIYALGGNLLASRLAGISTTAYLILTYTMCSTVVAFAGILVTARVGTGEATLGATQVLESITAVVIAGVSFFGGIGRLGNVVLGALFVTLVMNGMNLLRIASYQQQIVLGGLLILSVIIDQVRIHMLQQERAA
jgi:ribose transport system permease protein